MLELITAAPEPKSPPPRRKRDRRRTLTRIDRRSRLGKRIDELTILFAGALGGELSPVRKLRIERAAQLSALAEQARGDHMRNEGTSDIVRLERAACRGRSRPGRSGGETKDADAGRIAGVASMSGRSWNKPWAKLDPAVVSAIRLNSEKRSHADVAKQLKVNRTTVSRAMRRLTWRDVEP